MVGASTAQRCHPARVAKPQRGAFIRLGGGIELSASNFGDYSWYLEVRDRHSYALALVSVAAGLHITDGSIRAAAIALGCRSKPWRVPAAENSLLGNAPSSNAFHIAAELALSGAKALSQTGFKIDPDATVSEV